MKDEFPEIPEFIKDLMESGQELDEIRIDAQGCWFHNGEKFTNDRIISFFNKHVDVTKDGKYVINYDKFIYPIVVEDAPVFVIGVKIEGKGPDEKVILTLTNGDVQELDINTLHYKNSCLYCYIKKGKLLTKFKRSPSFELLYRLEETDDIYFLYIAGKKVVLAEKM